MRFLQLYLLTTPLLLMSCDPLADKHQCVIDEDCLDGRQCGADGLCYDIVDNDASALFFDARTDDTDNAQYDASSQTDSTALDATMPDVTSVDVVADTTTTQPDAGDGDASLPDAYVTDADLPLDAQTPDATSPDAAPDAGQPDAAARDASSVSDVPMDDSGDAGSAPLGNTGSLYFDGEDDYMILESAPPLEGLSTLTVEAWIKPVGTVNGGILSQRQDSNRYAVAIQTGDQNDRIRAQVNPSSGNYWSTSAVNSITPERWVHIAIVRNSAGHVTLYLDGQHIAYGTSMRTPQSTESLLIGALTLVDGTPNAFFKGYIDELRVWGTSRSQEQIQNHRWQVLAGTEQDLIGYWRFDSQAATLDSSPLNHSARLGDQPSPDGADPVLTQDVPFAGVARTFTPPQYEDRFVQRENSRSMHFDGQSQQLHIATKTLAFGEDMTVEFWVKPQRAQGTESMVGIYGSETGPMVAVRKGSDILQSTVWTYSASSANGSLPAQRWSHVAVSFDGDNSARVYINGQYCGYGGIDALQPLLNDLIFGIAKFGGAESAPFMGYIDEVRIWNQVRSQQQLQQYMWHTLVGDESGLIGYWDFEIENGDWVEDRSTSAAHGWLGRDLAPDQADPSYSDDVPFASDTLLWQPPGANTEFVALENSGSLYFDGASMQQVRIPDVGEAPLMRTVELWVKPTLDDQTLALVNKDHSSTGTAMSLNRTSSESASAQVWVQGATTAGSTVPIDQWTHIAAVYVDDDRIRLYINGVYQSYGLIDHFPENRNDLLLGIMNPGGAEKYAFTGYIDEVRYWSVDRNEAQIAASMGQTLAGNEPGLIGYWGFDVFSDVSTGDQQIVVDRSARGQHGYLGRSLEADATDPQPSSDKPF